MIAVDSSTLIAYIQGDTGDDVTLLDRSIGSNRLVLPPVVLTEVMSDHALPAGHAALIKRLAVMDLHDGFWLRAAQMRATLLSQKLRARLADTLVAQSCIDHDVALIARDGDFRHFAKHCGLKLA